MSNLTVCNVLGEGGEIDALKDLDLWRAKVEEAVSVKDQFTLEAFNQDDAMKKGREDLTSARKQQEQYHEESTQAMRAIEVCNVLGEGGEIADAMKDLDIWRAKVEKAVSVKDQLTLEAFNQDDAMKKGREDLTSARTQQEQYHEESARAMMAIEGEMLRLQKDNKDLMDQLKGFNKGLEFRRTEFIDLTQKLKFCAQIPDVKLKFSDMQREDGDHDDNVDQHISGFFTITQKPTMILNGGQALITFEEKEVASQIRMLARCSVPSGHHVLDVRPKRLTLESSSVKFALQLDMSMKELTFSGVQSTMPQERIRDRLESSFSKPSRGGGEVERVEYDHDTGTGKVTFLNTGVAASLARIGQCSVDLNPQVNVKVELVFQYRLERFQTFCGVPERSLLLDHIRDIEDEDEMSDTLEIFFQKPTNSGGEIESFKYISKGKQLLALFDVI